MKTRKLEKWASNTFYIKRKRYLKTFIVFCWMFILQTGDCKRGAKRCQSSSGSSPSPKSTIAPLLLLQFWCSQMLISVKLILLGEFESLFLSFFFFGTSLLMKLEMGVSIFNTKFVGNGVLNGDGNFSLVIYNLIYFYTFNHGKHLYSSTILSSYICIY